MSDLIISASNISLAWVNVFLALMQKSGTSRHPAFVTISQLDKPSESEIPAVRNRLDEELKRFKLNSCGTVANTIFPNSMWIPDIEDDAVRLYARYEKAWPGIAKCPANRNGVYFRRLTSYLPKGSNADPINQLDFIVRTYRQGNHRKSALQASILDPTRDHTNNRQKGFPCLQQVSFTPLEQGGLSVTGYYATQYHFEKAYGNYLGLYRLGRFMSKQLGLELVQVNCIAASLNLGDKSKSALQVLEANLKSLIVGLEQEAAVTYA